MIYKERVLISTNTNSDQWRPDKSKIKAYLRATEAKLQTQFEASRWDRLQQPVSNLRSYFARKENRWKQDAEPQDLFKKAV